MGASSMQVGSAFPLLHCPPGLSAEVIHLRIQGPHIPKLLREIKNPSKGSSVLVALGSVSAALGFVPIHIPGGYDISPQCLSWTAVGMCTMLVPE